MYFLDANSTWSGMIGDLMSGDCDLVSASLTMSPERANVVDFAHPVGTETYGIFVSAQGLEVGGLVSKQAFVLLSPSKHADEVNLITFQ